MPDHLPTILADTHQLRSALQQLLDTAGRYTEAGLISIRAFRDSEGVRLAISDTGRGISTDLSQHLFTRFRRVSKGITSAERAIGLGLADARQLIERQVGTLWLQSMYEHGRSFSFTLPCVDEKCNDRVIATLISEAV